MREGFVWLNGRLLPASEAFISPFDRGFLYGDGLFETLRVDEGVPCLIDRHLRRLYSSAGVIGLEHLPSPDELKRGIEEVIEGNNWDQARMRITCSRGVDREAKPTLFIHGRPLLQNEQHPQPVDLRVNSSVRERSPFPVRLKSLNYLPEILAFESALEQGASEGIFLTEEGYVAEGSISNIFCVVNGHLLTPPVSLGILPGIMREVVIEICEREGIPVHEERFPLQKLVEADEVFITNAVRRVVPVGSLGGERIRGYVPGDVTMRMRQNVDSLLFNT